MNLMAQTNFRGDDHQRGAVLVVGLIMLVVITLFVISMIKTSSIELKIGGISHIEALNFSNADLALNNFISLNNGQFAPGFLSIPAGSPGSPLGCNLATCGASNPPAVYGGTVTVTPVQLACGNDTSNGMQMGSGGLQVVQFDISSTATQQLGGSTTLHSGVQTSVLSCL
jgi:Tfp pilus assembly protein PilX